MQALIDGDLIVYRVGFTTEGDPSEIASFRVNDVIDNILRDTKADSYKVYLTQEDDLEAFRRKVYPEYKATRLGKPKPKWYHYIRDYLQVEWGAEVVKYIEADDALGIEQIKGLRQFDPDPSYWNQPEFNKNTIICSVDKDLKQIPGYHYNFVKQEKEFVETTDALRYFYKQLLTGDSADNIKGVYKVGPVKAEQILSGLTSEQELFSRVRETYGNDSEMLLNGRVLWIWRKSQDDWIHRFKDLAQCSDEDLENLKL